MKGVVFLVGLDAIAVDRQVLRFVHNTGVDLQTPDAVEEILTKAGRQLGLSERKLMNSCGGLWRREVGQPPVLDPLWPGAVSGTSSAHGARAGHA